ncbi:MAG: hypothetical protein C4549_02855 [Deltaproteobacteria bacterium]|jgi:hypothetical protein|nr:MAG: hypothetical protein C4549_02855 [Deltaproteobacteria bacterium]
MPRELSDKPCEVTFNDQISGDKITLYYRMPTSQEKIKYTNGYVTRRGNKIVSTLGELRMKAGAAVLIGFKTGAFSVLGKGLISSKLGDDNYDPDWKAVVKQYAPDVIEMLSIHVFESSLLRDISQGAGAMEVLPDEEDDWGEGDTGEIHEAKEDDVSPLS